MDVFKQYDVFKENCYSFPSRFEKKFFETARLVCHPTVENVLISVCSNEEAKSNGLNICRISDMLLMSDDCENWKSFSLQAARALAAEKGYIYLTDLLFEGAFYVEEWMIDGKHDTIVVSEEYMREKGKKYAPVTPLTNKVLHFKKTLNAFFWKSSSPDKIISYDDAGIKARLDEYCEEYSKNIPSLSAEDDIKFPLFNSNVTINTATSRALKINYFFSQLNNIISELKSAGSILESTDVTVSPEGMAQKLATEGLVKNGINITVEQFYEKYVKPYSSMSESNLNLRIEKLDVKSGNTEIEKVKLAFIDALTTDKTLGIVYPVGTSGEYAEKLRQIEQKDFEGTIGEGEEKFMISDILSHMPSDFAIFAYINAHFPEEMEKTLKIAEFWRIAPISGTDLQNLVFRNYLDNDLFDAQGNFCAGFERAVILREQLAKVNDKYKFDDAGFISDLDTYIKEIDLKRRSYNGTVFDTPEDMKRAMANELELQALCIDLGALDEAELIDLRKHINGVTADEATRAKYLVKVKIAMNRVEESMLNQQCLGLAMLDVDEAIKLKDSIIKANYAESVAKPFINSINDRLLTAEKEELEKLTADITKMNDIKLEELVSIISTDRYDKMLSKIYVAKIDEYKGKRIKSEIEKICSGMDSFNREQISDAKKKLLNSGYPEKYTRGMLNELDNFAADYNKKEAAKLFEKVSIASAEELESIKKAIADKAYPAEILAPYEGMLEAREKALLDEEITEKCAGIAEADKEKIDAIKAEINNPEKKYNPELVAKFNEEISRRNCELKNSELAEKCKYIFSMEQDKLNEIKEVLLSGKYDEDVSTLYLKKVTERETELRNAELDKLCENIAEADNEALEKLKADIVADEKYIGLVDPYVEKINAQIKQIKLDAFNKKLGEVASMDSEALEKFRSEIDEEHEKIGDELFNQAVNTANERADILEKAALDEIVEGIDEFTLEQCNGATEKINNGSFKQEFADDYIAKIDERIEKIYLSMLDAVADGYSDMDKKQLVEAIGKVKNLDCPAELKQPYIYMLEKAVDELAEKELRSLCGDIGSLSIKKANEIKLKINILNIDPKLKNQYLDSLDAHIMALEETEQKEYLQFLKEKVTEFDVPLTSFLIPDISNLFFNKYDDACKAYISAGKFELPLFLHDVDDKNGFALTTEYLYVFTNGVLNRIKIEDIASFQTKKSVFSASISVTERSAASSELPCGNFDKKAIEPTSKAMTALVNHINEKRAAEHVKELEKAAQEKAREAALREIAAKEKARAEEEARAKAEEAKAAEEMAQAEAAAKAEEAAKAEAEKTNETEKTAEDASKTEKAVSGEKVAEEAPKAEENAQNEQVARFCDQCGAKISNPKAKFCAECGNKLK